MKKNDIYEEIGNISPDLIAEADPLLPIVTRKTKMRRRFTITAVCASIALLLALAIVAVPYFNREEPFTAELPEELLKFADSKYIKAIYAIYNNNILGYSDFSSAPSNIMSDLNGTGKTSSYIEVTDNQVEGVIEGDLFKRSKSHIFYVDVINKTINSYKIKGEKTALAGQYKIDENTLNGRDFTPREIYLSKDCDTLTVVGQFYDYRDSYGGLSYNRKTVLASFDVSNPKKIKLKKTIVAAGEYITSRSVDGKIYWFYEFGINSYNKDFSDETKFVPQIDVGGGFRSIDMEDIVFTNGASEDMYTVIVRVDEDSLKIEDIKAIFHPVNEVFVSEDKIILVDNYEKYYEYEENSVKHVGRNRFSDLSVISIEKRNMEYQTGFTLEGSVEGQYSIDEYNGILRIAATTDLLVWSGDVWIDPKIGWADVGKNFELISPGTNASLYCIDTNSWETIAEVKDFAPWGEEVKSARYDGDMAYICTAEVETLVDPVYFFDLSDLNNITYTDTGTIEGYSTSLVDFGEKFLLGIGYGDNRNTLKIEVYKEGEGKVESVCSYIKEDVGYSEDYKAYYIDRERGLIGLMFRQNKNCTYILLHFDGEQITEVITEEMGDMRYPDAARATLIDDCFYIFIFDKYKAIELP